MRNATEKKTPITMQSDPAARSANRKSIADIFHNQITAWLVLGISLAFTALAWYVSAQHVDRRAADRFTFEVEDARDRIVSRMREYEQVLRGGVALFNATGRMINRTEWKTFVDGLQIETYFPGIQGIGYSKMLEPEQLAAHQAGVRAEGFSDYRVKPQGKRDRYSAIVYLEPFDWRNRRAFGYDMYSNPMRRAAMNHARDTDSPAVSGKVTLVQETEHDVQAGFLVYLPVYAPGAATVTLAERRAALTGFVYSPFRVADLMHGILGNHTPDVGFALFDGTHAGTPDSLLYDTDPNDNADHAAYSKTLNIALPGRAWSATFHSTPSFEAAMSSNQPEIVAVGGLIVDILLFTIIWSLGRQRKQVETRALAMTADMREMYERLSLAKDAAHIGIWDFDPRSQRLIWDARMHEIFGTAAEDFRGDVSDWEQRVHPQDLAAANEALQIAIAGQGRFETEFRIIRSDGGIRWIAAHANIVTDDSGNPVRVVGVNLDVTERRRTEEKLSLAASVFDHAHEGIIITDDRHRIVDVNPAFTDVTGYERDEVMGKTPALLRSGKHDEAFYEAIWDAIEKDGYWRGEIWNRRKCGEMFAQMETISVVKDTSGLVSRYIAVFSDITRLIEQQQRLEHLAHFDALTGLPNRVLLADRMQQAMSVARRNRELLAICYLDLDGFKPVNDRYGHAAGDQLLIQVAGRLRHHLRESDSVARLGGDEFAVLLSGINNSYDCETALERLVAALTGGYVVADNEMVNISASIGVALYPHDDVDADTLLRHADQAMYAAKEDGRGKYHIFDAEQNVQMQAHRQTIERIATALVEQEFVLFYQPKVNMRTGAVIGVEALIRWNHPERGILPPAAFLPAIENDDLAVALGTWVISEALRQQSVWLRNGIRIKVSVNISGRHLQQNNFAEHLHNLLRMQPDVPPSLMELEVLETTALDDIAHVTRIIEQSRELGVGVSLDDFGTGYSSLTYLKRLPADVLKVDRSFVRDMLCDAEDLAIVEGIVGLSKAFRRQVIAEGVETEAHGELLLRLGCDFAQGYGIARPMPAGQLTDWLRAYRQPAAWQSVVHSRWRRDDLPLYSAKYFHTRWLQGVLQASAARTEFTPADDLRIARAQFTDWYSGEGHKRYGHLSEFTAIAAVRIKFFDLIDELLARSRHAQPGDASEIGENLSELGQTLLDCLAVLQRRLDGSGDEAAATLPPALYANSF